MSDQQAIELQHVTVTYDITPALLDVNASIEPGQLIGIMGPNGSGKSTLIKALLGFVPLRTGRIKIHGRAPKAARGLISYVPQRSAIDWDFPVTVRDVALMGRYGRRGWWRDLSKDDHLAAEEALREVRMHNLRDRQIGQLSGGQQQRVFLARSLAQDAPVMLLDEPLAGVDAATETAIIDVLQSAKRNGKTVIVVHHDLATAAEYFDQVLLLKQRLFGFGPPREVLIPSLLAEVYEGNMRVFADLARQGSAVTSTTDNSRHR